MIKTPEIYNVFAAYDGYLREIKDENEKSAMLRFFEIMQKAIDCAYAEAYQKGLKKGLRLSLKKGAIKELRKGLYGQTNNTEND